ncbi:glycosyltransferase family 2 protein [Paraclostridium dentum]|uniref:glycosyltransferase family 2 protein n=1 Tax=Paraclostridium dentum TaxID=2662455 RepID=UPI003463CEC8
MVSIIIPTYNRAGTLKRCIESLLKQTYRDYEIIIVDDNSNDDTEYIVKGFEDYRIRYVRHNKNLGANAARNTGIDIAKGEYIAFQDSDDEWHVNKLELQMNELNEKDVDIVACSFIKFYKNKKKIVPKEKIDSNNLSKSLLYKNCISTQTILGKSGCFKENKFDNKFPRFQDWELMIRLSQKYKIYFMQQPLVNVYVQEDSISKKPDKAIIAINLMIEKYKDIIMDDKKALGSLYSLIGDMNLEMNCFEKNYYIESLKYNNFNYKTYIRIVRYYIEKLYRVIKK